MTSSRGNSSSRPPRCPRGASRCCRPAVERQEGEGGPAILARAPVVLCGGLVSGLVVAGCGGIDVGPQSPRMRHMRLEPIVGMRPGPGVRTSCRRRGAATRPGRRSPAGTGPGGLARRVAVRRRCGGQAASAWPRARPSPFVVRRAALCAGRGIRCAKVRRCRLSGNDVRDSLSGRPSRSGRDHGGTARTGINRQGSFKADAGAHT